MRIKVITALAVLVFLSGLALLMLHTFRQPSNDRDWSVDQAVLASATFNGDLVTIKNIRNFSYASTTSYTPNYYDTTFDLSKIKKVHYVVEPFKNFGAAHTFPTFEFDDNQFISVSVEIRKQKGEMFSAVKGLFRNYEIMYVIADERDLITLRALHRKDPVYIYPVNTSAEKVRALFVSMLERANELAEKPEFYNTLTNTCTTNIMSHVNIISPKRVPFSFKVLLPRYSDELAYDLGLIDNSLPFEEIKAKHLVNSKVEKYQNDPEFSVKIRGEE